MQDNFLDLRWLLLENLFHVENLTNWHKVFFCIFFILFSFISLINLVKIYIPSISKKKYLFSNTIFIIILIVFIIAGRWPGLLAPMLNPDEAQFIAGAMKLLKDPFFWHSVDAGSSGPLNVYSLVLPAVFGIRLEYASARLIGLILVLISIISLYYSLNFIYGQFIAKLATFLIAVTFATMRFPDYIHYSSEHIPIAILSLTLLVICYGYSRPLNDNRLIFLSGVLLGVIPCTKMQGVPMAFSLGVMDLHIIWLKSSTKSQLIRSWTAFALGLPVVSVFLLLYLIVFSIFDDFWKSYIQQNLLFYSTDYVDKTNSSLIDKFIEFFSFVQKPAETRFLFGLTGGILVLVLPFLITLQYRIIPKEKASKTFPFVYYSLGFLLLTLYAVTKPGTNFGHYLLFLIIPSGFLIGVCLGELRWIIQNTTKESSLYKFCLRLTMTLAILLVLSSSLQIYQVLSKNNFYLANRRNFSINYHSPLVQTILKYGSPGDTLAIWGWANELYVDTGMIQGVRDGSILWQIKPTPLQSYYQKRFADDLVNSKAPVFVDAVAPGMFRFEDRKTQGHEVFPEIAKVVEKNYKLVEEVQGVRIYVLKK